MQTQPQTNGKPHPAAANGTTVTSASAPATDKADARTALESALLQVEGIKTSFREAINGLTKLGDSIRHAMREQKVSEKEVHNVRQTLRSLQGVRL